MSYYEKQTNIPYFSLTRRTTYVPVSGANILFDYKRTDNLNNVNTNSVFITPINGIYHFTANISFVRTTAGAPVDDSGNWGIRVVGGNTTFYDVGENTTWAASSANSKSWGCSITLKLSQNDQVAVYTTGMSGITIQGNSITGLGEYLLNTFAGYLITPS